MLIYNVTIKIDWNIAEEWLNWMKQIHIPEVMQTGCFDKHAFLRLLEIDETEGPTYAVQYFANSINEYNTYIATYAPLLRQKTIDAWGNKYIAFRSLMEMV